MTAANREQHWVHTQVGPGGVRQGNQEQGGLQRSDVPGAEQVFRGPVTEPGDGLAPWVKLLYARA